MTTISFTLPPEIEESLSTELGDLNAVAKEATLVELYRKGAITRVQLRKALGIARLEVDEVLKRHNVTEDLLTVEEFEAQRRRLAELLGP